MPSYRFRRRFSFGTIRRDPKGEVDTELEFHFAQTVEDLIHHGYTPAAAQDEAQRRFGDVERYRRELEQLTSKRLVRTRYREWWSTVLQDATYAVRGFRRSPGFTAGVVLTLALGIGANATMFGVIDRLLLSAPPHVEYPDGVRRLYVERGTRAVFRTATLTYPDVTDFTPSQSFETVAAYSATRLTMGRGDGAVQVAVTYANASFFKLLGVTPRFGRFFDETEDRIGAPGTVVLSHEFWQRRFGGELSVLGHALDIGSGTFTVIRVAPRSFTGVDLRAVDVWIPLHTAIDAEQGDPGWYERRGWYWVRAIARLNPGVTVAAAETEATRLHRLGRKEYIDQNRYSAEAHVIAGPLVVARGPFAPNDSIVALQLLRVRKIIA